MFETVLKTNSADHDDESGGSQNAVVFARQSLLVSDDQEDWSRDLEGQRTDASVKMMTSLPAVQFVTQSQFLYCLFVSYCGFAELIPGSDFYPGLLVSGEEEYRIAKQFGRDHRLAWKKNVQRLHSLELQY